MTGITFTCSQLSGNLNGKHLVIPVIHFVWRHRMGHLSSSPVVKIDMSTMMLSCYELIRCQYAKLQQSTNHLGNNYAEYPWPSIAVPSLIIIIILFCWAGRLDKSDTDLTSYLGGHGFESWPNQINNLPNVCHYLAWPLPLHFYSIAFTLPLISPSSDAMIWPVMVYSVPGYQVIPDWDIRS